MVECKEYGTRVRGDVEMTKAALTDADLNPDLAGDRSDYSIRSTEHRLFEWLRLSPSLRHFAPVPPQSFSPLGDVKLSSTTLTLDGDLSV
jgi:hypothetical protein